MRNGLILCAAMIAGVLACAHEPQKAAPTAAPAPAAQRQAATTPSSSGPHSCSSDSDCAETQLCIRSVCVDITPDLAECSTMRVHFDFNESNLRDDDEAKLQRMGRCLKVLHALHVTIDGNADERGTEEWNLALGDKRATAVESYLQRLGVSADQLKTVTYGKDRPLCTQHNEDCWSKNRRAGLHPKESR